jgi:hypothetical protein
MDLRPALLFLCLLLPLTSTAQQAPENQSVGWVETDDLQLGPRQNSRRAFSIDAYNQSTASILVSMTEDIFSNVEKFTALDLVNPEGFWLEVLARDRGEHDGRNIVFAQSYSAEVVRQRVLIWDMPSMEAENYIEAATWLVLNRYVLDRQSPALRVHQPAVVPDWLSVGMAQCLISPLRIRNQRIMQRLVSKTVFPKVETILSWSYLPEGRWAEKVVASQFVLFLQDSDKRASSFESLFAQLAEKGQITPQDILAVMPQISDEEALERAWKNWLMERKTSVLIPGLLTVETLSEFAALLSVNKGDFGIPRQANFPDGMPLSGLIPFRKEPWARQFAVSRLNELNLLALGRGAEMASLVEGYKSFLISLTGDAKDDDLLAKSVEAEKVLTTLEETLKSRRAYLDKTESKLLSAETEELMIWFWEGETPGRSDLQKYIDMMERRF